MSITRLSLRWSLPLILLAFGWVLLALNWRATGRAMEKGAEARQFAEARSRLAAARAALEPLLGKSHAEKIQRELDAASGRSPMDFILLLNPSNQVQQAAKAGRPVQPGLVTSEISQAVGSTHWREHEARAQRARQSGALVLELAPGGQAISAAAPVGKWLLVGHWDISQARAAAWQPAFRAAAVGTVLLWGGAALLWWFLGRALTRRSDRLIAAAGRIRAGDSRARSGAVEGSANELDQAGRSFDAVADELEEARVEAAARIGLLNRAQRAAGIASWSWSAAGGLEFSDFMFELCGLKSGSKLDWPALLEAAHPEDRPELEKRVRALAASPAGRAEIMVRLRGEEGASRRKQRILLSAEIERGGSGEPLRAFGIAREAVRGEPLDDGRDRGDLQLRQSQKMEALGTLAGGIAHDFNNIVGAIMGNAELARVYLPEGHAAQESLSNIMEASCRARDLVRQILAFSRRQEGTRKPVRLQGVIAEEVKVLRPAIPPAVEIELRAEPDCPPVLADSAQIHQILLNLCTNAAQAMPQRRGVIQIEVNEVELSADSAASRGLKEGTHVRMEVRDNGVGMNAETLEKIFDPFFTTKPPGQGTGLGLAVVDGIVRAHEGAISASSAVGKGTVFHIYFPAAEQVEKSAESAAARLRPGRGEHILVVDDEPPMVSVFTRTLKTLGYHATGMTDPAAALEAVRLNPAGFDLVLTDLTMPTMLGTDLAAELVKVRKDLPVVLVTGLGATLTVEAVRARGVVELISKPATKETLAAVLELVLEGRRLEKRRTESVDGIFPGLKEWWTEADPSRGSAGLMERAARNRAGAASSRTPAHSVK